MEVKLPAQSLTASNRNQTHVIGLFKVFIFVGYCSFVAIAKRKYVGSCDRLENLSVWGGYDWFHCTQKVSLVIELGSEVEVCAKFEVTVLCVMSAPF